MKNKHSVEKMKKDDILYDMTPNVFSQKSIFTDELPVTVNRYIHRPDNFDPAVDNLREFWKITLLEDRRILFHFQGKKIPLEAETLFISRPEDLTNIEADAPCRITNLLITGRFWNTLIRDLSHADPWFAGLAEKAPMTARFLHRVHADGRLRSLVRRIVFESAHTDSHTENMLRCLLQTLLIEGARRAKTEKRHALSEHRVSMLCDYLQTHFREKITLNALAAEFGMAPNALNRQFKAGTGQTTGQFLRCCRTEQAAELLRTTAQDHRKIWQNCGFPNPGSFYRAFQQSCGMTPEQYRKRFFNGFGS